MLSVLRPAGALLILLLAQSAHAGAQVYEQLSDSVRAGMQASIADKPAPRHGFSRSVEAVRWMTTMSQQLERRIPNIAKRIEFLRTVHYESTRAGLDPQLVLSIVHVESNFRKFALSHAGARGYMQVMPFWIGLIGRPGDNLFDLRTSLRYGCVILRHYLNIENGDLFRALGRYNGSLGRPEYPNAVFGAMESVWNYPTSTPPSS